jgi:hypothetical protein
LYRPKQGREREENARSPGRRGYLDAMLFALTLLFWVAALIFVGLMALYAFTGSIGTTTSGATGISLLLVTVSSGATAWIELKNNPLDDTERGEWTNKMLFYGLVCAISFFVACLYLPALYFAP